MESLGRMVAILLAVILLLLFPLRYDALLQKETVESYVNQEMEYFFYQITTKHHIDVSMYEEFTQRINASGDFYTVGIESYVPTIIGETSANILDYENVLEQLKTDTKVEFETNDYLVITIHKNSESFYDRLTNLFLPMFAANDDITIGGSMQ
jgi:hypothetical protein